MADRIREEETFLEDFLTNTEERAESLIDLLTCRGITSARVHVNVDPVIGLGNVERIGAVLDRNRQRLEAELVAFPQHGLLKSGVSRLMHEAMTHGTPIDLHLHDRGSLGIYTIEKLADYVEDAGWQGKVTISHAYCLGDAPLEEVIALGERLVDLGISLATTAPIDVPSPPLFELQRIGLDVRLVNDNIHDHWSPFGSGDLLQRASRAAEQFGRIDENALRMTLPLITGGKNPLDGSRNRSWPKVGDAADLLLVDASCSAEAIARVPERSMVIHAGRITHP